MLSLLILLLFVYIYILIYLYVCRVGIQNYYKKQNKNKKGHNYEGLLAYVFIYTCLSSNSIYNDMCGIYGLFSNL